MKRNTEALASAEFDLVVVGGGIFGVAALWEAAQRGLSAVLLERDDFAHAASSNHFRMVHGGIRYLQHGDLYRVRESSAERSAMLRIAPHLVEPLPIVVPTYGHGMRGKEVLAAGLALYDLVTADRNRKIPDPARHTPRGRILSRQETLDLFPNLKRAGLTGAALFHDGQIYHPARIALAFLKSAMDHGAQTANYVEVTGLLRHCDRVTGVEAVDRLTGEAFEVRGKVVLNAAGAWAAPFVSQYADLRLRRPPSFSRDACFIVRRPLVGKYALAVEGATRDPDAIIARGNRQLFIVPWQGHTLVGVWHVVHRAHPDAMTVTESDLQGFLAEINAAHPGLGLKLDDISRWMAGLTLFGENKPGQRDLSYGHRSLLIDHSETHRVEGLITLIGVRATTARGLGEKAVDLTFQKLGRKPVPSRTEVTPLAGGNFERFESLLQEARQRRPAALDEAALVPLLRHHGSNYPRLFAYVASDPELGRTITGSNTPRASVVHAVREEMPQTLEDVLLRRTDIGVGGHPGEAALQECADLMGQELGWDQARRDAELAAARSAFALFGEGSRVAEPLQAQHPDVHTVAA